MNNPFSTRNNISGAGRFQLRTGFFRSNWPKIGIVLVTGLGLAIASLPFTPSSGAISLLSPEESPAVTVQASAINKLKFPNYFRPDV